MQPNDMKVYVNVKVVFNKEDRCGLAPLNGRTVASTKSTA